MSKEIRVLVALAIISIAFAAFYYGGQSVTTGSIK